MKHAKLKKRLLVTALSALLVTGATALSALADDIRWDFDIEGEPDGWTKTNCTGTVSDGYFNLIAATNQVGNYDPFISHAVDFAAKDYRYIVFSMKYENDRTLSNDSHIYFSTDTKGLSEETRVSNPTYQGKTSGGKYLVQVFDMASNPNWTGTVKSFRIDAVNQAATFSIDYVYVTNTLPETYDIITKTSKGTASSDGKTTYFPKQKDFSGNEFSDVSKNEWYYGSVESAYELGFMNGTGEGFFSPEGNMTVAEGVTIASRVHSIYENDGEAFEQVSDGEWYTPYVNYAVENGIWTETDGLDYERNIKRSEMAELFVGALPVSYLNEINSIGYVPDLPLDASYKQSVLTLYRAGVLMGSDEYGSFQPDNDITRAEAAAIIGRVALPENRVSGSLKRDAIVKAFEPKEAGHYLIDNQTLLYGGVLQDGWDYNYAGCPVNIDAKTTNVLDDMSEKADSFLRRYINKQSDGILKLSVSYKLGYDPNGAYIRMGTDTENLFRIVTHDTAYYIETPDGEYPLGLRATLNQNVWLDASLDLDEKSMELYMDGAYFGTYALNEKALPVSLFEVGTTVEGTPMINTSSVYLTKDYYFTDDFNNGARSAFAITAGDNEVTTAGELSAALKAGKPFEAKAAVASASGNICTQLIFYADSYADGLTFAWSNGDTDVFTLTTKNGKLVTGKGKTVDKTLATSLWNTLRVEADTATGKAIVKINGKVVAEAVDFDNASDAIDAFSIRANTAKDMTLKADYAFMTELFEYDDYVPEPVVAETDYIIGMNVCSLWREGYHKGWGCISPYEEIIPVLGFYDEGLPEVSDWEIKFMVEHGISYQIYCWYGNSQSAIKPSRGADTAIHDGFFNAKYSDKMKFAIQWENTSTTTTFEDFKNNVVPYWVEYYLTDPRYMTVDNKPVVTVWSVGTMVSKYGLEDAKAAVEYLRQTCVDLGYDGLLFLCCDQHSTRADQFKTLASIGCDATYAYHWNEGGAKYYNQTARMQNYLTYNEREDVPDEEKILLIPTISAGFNSIAWHSKRTGLIEAKGIGSVCEFIKESVLPTLTQKGLDKMIVLSNWNEYGEGTYMMPSEGLGFTFLDAVKENLCKADGTKNVVPTAAQKARLGYLYPQDRHLLSPMYNADISEYPQEVIASFSVTEDNMNTYHLYSQGSQKFTEDGHYTAMSTGNSIIMNKEPLDINIDDCSYIRVTIRGEKDSVQENLQGFFFFSTDNYPNIEEATRTEFIYPNGGDMDTYYVNIGNNSRWHGTLKTLRLDPAYLNSFELVSYELLRDDAKKPIVIDGKTLKTYGVINPDGEGHILVPAVPTYGTFTAIRAYARWDKTTETLYVQGNGHTVTMTIGSNKAIVDGKEQEMYTSLEYFDGVPLLPYDALCKYLGYSYDVGDFEASITTGFGK